MKKKFLKYFFYNSNLYIFDLSINNQKQLTMNTYKTIEQAAKIAIEKTGALRISKQTDGVNLQMSGYDFFGNTCFNIYKTYTNQYSKVYIIRYTNN